MLSVIIPTLNSERTLVPTLAMLVPGAMSGVVRDVVLADAGSTDATAEIADIAGCIVISSPAPAPAPFGHRLREAAAAARASWLMFLRPGIVLDATWVDETARFIAESDRDQRVSLAAVFRRAVSPRAAHPLAAELMTLVTSALLGRPHPDQGLVIAARLYKDIGGHRDGAADPEADLLARLGRRRIRTLRSGAQR
jgi:glycosyltransferase involved in cell wall biosynthesis